MIYSKYRISLDIRSIGSQVVLMSKRLETGREIYITLTEGLKTYAIADDCYAVFAAIKPDGNFLFNFCNIEDNTITYTYTPQTTIVAGKMECEIRLYSSKGEMLTSAFFGILISDTIVDEGEVIESAFESTAITALVEQKVTEYMVEHPIATDATLTDPEAAANAKATGEAIAELSQQTTEALENMQTATSEALQATNEALEDKVDSEENKGLSSNDFTNEYKEKLDGIEAGANKYVLGEDVGTENVKAGAITRAKLANDALYSQLISAASREITVADIGRTLRTPWNTTAEYTLSQAVSTKIPPGAEIAAVRFGYLGDATISFPDGVRVLIPGETSYKANAKIQIADTFGTIALKKLSHESNGDTWIVTGNVEVVS